MQARFPVGSKVFHYGSNGSKVHCTVGTVPKRYQQDSWAHDPKYVWFTNGTWLEVDRAYQDKSAVSIQKGVLEEVQDTLKERGNQNGYDTGKERSAAKIAKVFNALTGRDLTEQEAWTFMICLKLVRNQHKPRRDNIVDLIGYTALLGESQGEAI